MKIIISENQYKLILENEENKENLMPFPMDRIVGDSEKKSERFNQLISKFNPKRYDGIVIIGDFNYGTLSFIKKDSLNTLFNNIVRVNGDLKLNFNKKITSLNKLKVVTGNLNLNECSNLERLEELESVGGDISLRFNNNLTSLGKLTKIKKSLYLTNCSNLKTLGNIEEIGDDLILSSCENLKDLGNLKEVKGSLFIDNTPLEKYSDEEISKMIKIGGKIYRD